MSAVANYDDCASWAGAEGMVQQAVDTFGRLDVLICNAGILRDKMSFNMSEDEFDSVIRVHLKGHFAPSHFAGAYWRAQAKATGEPVEAAIVTTSSESGLYGNAGPGELRRRQGGDRGDDDHDGPRARPLRGAGELDRAGRRDPPSRHGRRGLRPRREPKYSPDNPAAGAVWLASPLADGITGQVLKITAASRRSSKAGTR